MKEGLEQLFDGNYDEVAINEWKPTTPLLITSVAASIIVGFLFSNILISRNSIENKPIAPQVIMLSNLRGNQSDFSFPTNEPILLQIPVDIDSKDLYQTHIVETTYVLFTVDNLKPIDDLVSILIPPKLLVAGEYRLKITNKNTHAAQFINFNVVN